ncbi:MAG: cupin domain-containing protein, partial [Eubacterium sp.]|nr:cupin domain-containing protein [Eubacterium sp.]
MIRFTWNGVLFNITNIGGGLLEEDIPRHIHSKNSYELHFVLGGKGTLITDTNEYELSTGNFFITGPNIYHEQTADKNNPVKDVFFMLQAVNTDKANAISSVFLENH